MESTGRVWVKINNQLQPLRVRLGITDGQATELLEGEIADGAELVTNVTTGTEVRPAATGIGFPMMGGQPRGGFPGGGGGGQRQPGGGAGGR